MSMLLKSEAVVMNLSQKKQLRNGNDNYIDSKGWIYKPKLLLEHQN